MRRIRLWEVCGRIAYWNPPPIIAYTGKDDEPMSWWFWRRMSGMECLYEHTWLGDKWHDFWFGLCQKFAPGKRKKK